MGKPKNIIMKLTLKDVPPEVQKVWAVQHYCQSLKTGVGSELYNECIEIIKKNPKWFPKETEALNKIQKDKS